MTALHLVTDADERALVDAAEAGELGERLLVSVIVALVRDVKELKKEVKNLKAGVGYLSA